MLIEILDKTIPGDISNSFRIELEETTTPLEIISVRVAHEVGVYNKKADDKLQSLVRPIAKETILNGLKKRKEIDIEKQIYVALEGFQKNAFFILVDEEQVSELNQKICLKVNSKINFIKLTPLVGG
ncbi:MAG: hypothetical protein JKY44_01170 [Flavobacteriaceae bacterium]|nr:hypothetical protein [Flavobacteriaceae bacterium]